MLNFLKRKIINFEDDFFGLDLDESSVKIVYFAQENEKQIKSYGKLNLPTGIISGGEIINEEVVAKKIKEAVNSVGPKKIRTKKVKCSLPESKSFLRLIEVPKMNEEELKEAIKWEIEANIPMDLEDVYYDWYPLPKCTLTPENKKMVLVAAISKKITNKLLGALDDAGLEAICLEPSAVAQIRGLGLGEKINKGKPKTVLIVDFKENKTNLLFVVGSVPFFTTSIPISNRMITEEVAKEFNVSTEKAMAIKSKHKNSPLFGRNSLAGPIETVLDGLVNEIEKSIDFCLNDLHHVKAIDEIILSGKIVDLKGVAPYLEKTMNKKVSLCNPLKALNWNEKKLPIIKKAEMSDYSTAIGLALNNNQ